MQMAAMSPAVIAASKYLKPVQRQKDAAKAVTIWPSKVELDFYGNHNFQFASGHRFLPGDVVCLSGFVGEWNGTYRMNKAGTFDWVHA
jgi:hypothetical protein